MLSSRLHIEQRAAVVRRVRRANDASRRMRAVAGSNQRFGHLQPTENEFADLVVRRVQAGVLRYSDRQALLNTATKMGIQRFDANLLIAMAQHRLEQKTAPQPERGDRWSLIAAAVILQCIILGSFYWLLH
ncbi:MAG TPA: hypothetical protein VGG19_20060 [Tepidisphaeraceae bacterium]